MQYLFLMSKIVAMDARHKHHLPCCCTFFFLMDVYNSTKAPGSYFTPSHNAAALKASSGRRSRRARAGADSRLPSVMREAGGGRPGYRISLLTGPTAALARAALEKKKLPAEVGQS